MLDLELQNVVVLIRMQVLAPDGGLYSSNSPRKGLQRGADLDFVVWIAARLAQEVTDLLVVEWSHYRRVLDLR